MISVCGATWPNRDTELREYLNQEEPEVEDYDRCEICRYKGRFIHGRCECADSENYGVSVCPQTRACDKFIYLNR